jgi:hypothetical protein
MMKTARRRYCLLIVCLSILMLGMVGSVRGQSLDPMVVESKGQEDDWITAVVVVRAASGASYMDDRDYIATMPELETIEEMQAHIAKYEPNPKDMQRTSEYLKKLGFKIVAQDNLFLVISGHRNDFGKIIPRIARNDKQKDFRYPEVYTVHQQDLNYPTSDVPDAVEGMIIHLNNLDSSPTEKKIPRSTGELLSVKPFLRSAGVKCPEASKTVEEIAELLYVDQIHAQNILGTGVKIGFIDQGVYTGHNYFYRRSMSLRSHRFVNGEVTVVGNNFEDGETNGHGTMVASFLSTFAPGARLYSFSEPLPSMSAIEDAPDDYVIEYMTYMNGWVDIISLSIGPVEEETSVGEMADYRQAIINFVANGGVIFVAAGNANQVGTSGHNALAGIPEVIAVGGADFGDTRLDYTAAGNYNDPSYLVTGSASFESELYPGNHVPDIVGAFGPDICSPYPAFDEESEETLETYIRYSCGTSGATPQIAGMAALLKEKDPTLNQIQVRSILQEATRDIWQGQSGDGDQAAPGYDAATGYGIPLATAVLNQLRVLHKGWNLIGLAKDHGSGYSALDMLNEINEQAGYSCDGVFSSGEGVILDKDGEIYGFDFDLELGVAYWVRCQNRAVWTESGSWVRTTQPLHFRPGLNLISIPYSEVPCTVKDVVKNSGSDNCERVWSYDGQMQEASDAHGKNFSLSAGKGYLVLCNRYYDWTPTNCGDTAFMMTESSQPANYYAPNPEASHSLTQLTTHGKSLAMNSASDSICAPQDMRITNVSDRLFSVSWTTQEPCMGSMIVNTGAVPVFRAYDDRGLDFSGMTHHITLRGLEPDTIYSFGLLSGDVWDTNVGNFYQVRTGKVLRQPGNDYDILGQLTGPNAAEIGDAIIYVQLQNNDLNPTAQSTSLSLPWDEYLEGYVLALDNARNQDATAYFDYNSATHVRVEAEGGSLEDDIIVLPVDLVTSPSITATDLTVSGSIIDKSLLITPLSRTLDLRPTFTFSATDNTDNALTYRLELSNDGFASIDKVYDQRNSSTGWSAASYSSGEKAKFTIPHKLENLRGYQWRVFAYNGEAWSLASDIGSFSVIRYLQVYLPLVLRNITESPVPSDTPTPPPTATPTATSTPLPTIPDPIYPTSTPTPEPVNTITSRIRFHGRSTENSNVGGHNVYVRAVIRETDGTIVYEGDDLTVVSGTSASEDYGTLTLAGLSNIVVDTPYELLITGKMHLTRKWTVTFDTSSPLLNLTDADDLLWSGDLNADNRVGEADADIFWDEFFDPSTPEMAYKLDINGDGEPSVADYALLKDSYQNGPGVGDE